MPYEAEISRTNPSCILFLIDESGSMSDRLEFGSKADEVANILNKTLADVLVRCSKDEGVRHYFDVGVISYQNDRPRNALQGVLSQRLLHSTTELEKNPLRVEDRMRKVSDGAGGLVEMSVKFPVWYDAKADGGTPMCEALRLTCEVLLDWCDAHPKSFPPVVIHLTDGASTDGEPEPLAEQLRRIRTEDGETILINVHISGSSTAPVAFPSSEHEVGDDLARQLFRMSSELPQTMAAGARGLGFNVKPDSRAFVFNAKTEEIIKFFDIGTRPANLR